MGFVKTIDYFKYIEAQERMCDEYCYFRKTTTDPENLEEHCEKCPMAKLLNNEDD